jgi:hypothetical protein
VILSCVVTELRRQTRSGWTQHALHGDGYDRYLFTVPPIRSGIAFGGLFAP